VHEAREAVAGRAAHARAAGHVALVEHHAAGRVERVEARTRQVIGELVNGFPGPVLYGLPSGHTSGATLTLPFGVRARVITGARPALVIEESAVEERPGV